jgi:hypothetical protein
MNREIMALSPGAAHDCRRVALIKSFVTNNRFYALVPPESGIRNADVVEIIPHDWPLGIAYPCLEDGLNDFAVIRTTYETLEIFPDDQALRAELEEMISDARQTLVRRLMELLERFLAHKAHFLGTDLGEFKNAALQMMQRGFPRHSLDQMMKVDVFSSVGRAAGNLSSTHNAEIYRYEFRNSDSLQRIEDLEGREFLLALLSDVLDSVLDEENYQSKYQFDCNVFQQFIALIFITYSATDPVFYGTHKEDYGVSKDKDMDDTPLYRAIGRELRRLTENMPATDENPEEPDAESWAEIGAAFEHLETNAATISGELANEELLLRHIASICATAHQLRKRQAHALSTQGAGDLAQLIVADAARLVEMLKQIGVISPLAYNPGESELEELQRRLNGEPA